MVKIYRTSDAGNKTLPPWTNRNNCFKNFTKEFSKDNVIIIADNCNDSTYQFLKEINIHANIYRTNLGNAGSLKYAFELALNLSDNEIIYFCEDDFLHLPDPELYLEEGLSVAHYVTGYNHPDKYLINGPNPYVNLGEVTKVVLTKHTHWKYTNSTVQTFACRVKTLKEDKDILWKFNFQNNTPDSFKTFIELGKKKRYIASAIPGFSTHCHKDWLAPLIDWEEVNANIHD